MYKILFNYTNRSGYCIFHFKAEDFVYLKLSIYAVILSNSSPFNSKAGIEFRLYPNALYMVPGLTI